MTFDHLYDQAKTELPRVVHLAEDRREFRMFVHGIVQAPHGVWHTLWSVKFSRGIYGVKLLPTTGRSTIWDITGRPNRYWTQVIDAIVLSMSDSILIFR